MMEHPLTFLYFPGGGGGGEHDMAAFAAGLRYPVRFETIAYPGWQRYVEDGFSAESLVAELTAETVKRVPAGPVRIMGLSLGGHLGYAVALRLREMGRKVALFCAIDSFLVASSEPSSGWQRRALGDALDLLRKGRFKELATFARSKAWRAVMRLAGGRLTGQLRRFSGSGQLPAIFTADAVAEHELSMRLLLREIAPWVAALDRNPVPLPVPAILLRTAASAQFDQAWTRRCPHVAIREVPGKHLTLFEPENIAGLRQAFAAAADQLEASPQMETP
jgi:thioesterase domain-containing protein